MSSAIGPPRHAGSRRPDRRADTTTTPRRATAPRRGRGATASPAGSCCACCGASTAASLTIVEGSERITFGRHDPERPLRVTLRVRSPRFYRALLRGSIGLCESYMDGLWECADLVALTPHRRAERTRARHLRRVLAPVLIPVQRWMRWLARNTPGRSRRQIAAHYDLGNELFALFLDPTMMYSCAVFESPAGDPRGGLADEARAGLREARARARRPRAGDRHRLGRVRRVRRRALRLPRDDDDDLPRTARLRRASACARRGLQDRVTVLLEDYRDARRRQPTTSSSRSR